MPRYKISRDVSGWTLPELYAGRFRGQFCAFWFDDMHWITSYYDAAGEELTCIFDARGEDDLRAHGRAANLPVTAIREVLQMDPPAMDEVTADGSAADLDRDAFFEAERGVSVTTE
jgi:hypothetical protein